MALRKRILASVLLIVIVCCAGGGRAGAQQAQCGFNAVGDFICPEDARRPLAPPPNPYRRYAPSRPPLLGSAVPVPAPGREKQLALGACFREAVADTQDGEFGEDECNLVRVCMSAQGLDPGFTCGPAAGMLGPTCQVAGGVVTKGEPWAGINPGHGGTLANAAQRSSMIAATTGLGLGISRVGIDHPLDRQEAIFDDFLAQGLTIHAVLSTFNVTPDAFRARARAAMERFKGKIGYYIIGNEPDLNGQSPAQAVEFTRIAYEESRRVAPDGSIRVESSPPSSPTGRPGTYMRDMLNLGVTNYADVIGLHSYGGQIVDSHRQGLCVTWRLMAEATQRYGHPAKPIANSEGGTSPEWAQGVDGNLYWARWLRQSYVQHKRCGYNSMLLYTLGSGTGLFTIPTCGAACADAIRESHQDGPFANGGFEQPNDREREWVIITNRLELEATPSEWSRVAFVTGGGARTGNGYMRTTAPVAVRRVGNCLTPGSPVTVSAWVRVAPGATASLKAQGYNHLDGDAEIVAQTGNTGGAWRELTLTVTPTNPWVVVSLESGGSGAVDWDDVTLNGKTEYP